MSAFCIRVCSKIRRFTHTKGCGQTNVRSHILKGLAAIQYTENRYKNKTYEAVHTPNDCHVLR